MQASGYIYRVSSDEKILAGGLLAGGCNLARIDADAHLQASGFRVALRTPRIEQVQRCLHVEGGADGAVRIIFVCDWHAKDCHHRIPDVFLNCAAMASYLLRHQVKVAG